MRQTSEALFVEEGAMGNSNWYPLRDLMLLLKQKNWPCPCGCGRFEKILYAHGNCAEAEVDFEFPCGAEGHLRLFESSVNDWELEIEML